MPRSLMSKFKLEISELQFFMCIKWQETTEVTKLDLIIVITIHFLVSLMLVATLVIIVVL